MVIIKTTEATRSQLERAALDLLERHPDAIDFEFGYMRVLKESCIEESMRSGQKWEEVLCFRHSNEVLKEAGTSSFMEGDDRFFFKDLDDDFYAAMWDDTEDYDEDF